MMSIVEATGLCAHGTSWSNLSRKMHLLVQNKWLVSTNSLWQANHEWYCFHATSAGTGHMSYYQPWTLFGFKLKEDMWNQQIFSQDTLVGTVHIDLACMDHGRLGKAMPPLRHASPLRQIVAKQAPWGVDQQAGRLWRKYMMIQNLNLKCNFWIVASRSISSQCLLMLLLLLVVLLSPFNILLWGSFMQIDAPDTHRHLISVDPSTLFPAVLLFSLPFHMFLSHDSEVSHMIQVLHEACNGMCVRHLASIVLNVLLTSTALSCVHPYRDTSRHH